MSPFRFQFAWIALTVVGSVALASTGLAQEAAEEPPPVDDAAAEKGLRGFEVMLRPGYGAAGSKSPVKYEPAPLVIMLDPGSIFSQQQKPYGGGFAGDLSLGFRPIPFFSFGLYGEMRSSSASGVADSTDVSRSAWGAGFYFRGYLPMLHEALDPYVSVGVGYVRDKQTYNRNTVVPINGVPTNVPVEWELTHHGVTVPLVIGVSYRALPFLAVGPSFRYSITSPAGGCVKQTVQTAIGPFDDKRCADAAELKRIVKVESYGAWSAGLDIRLTIM